MLTRRPDLLHQQLFNRLQWEDEPPPPPAGDSPWLRLRSPLRESRALIQTLEGPGDHVDDCAIAPDGSYVVSASGDGTLRFWDAAGGRELRTVQAHERFSKSCAIAPDGSFVVSGGEDGTLKLWEPSSGALLRSLDAASAVWTCAIAPGCAYLAFPVDAVTLRLADPASGRTLRDLKGHTGVILGCAISPDGALVASTSSAGEVLLWDAASGRELRRLRGHGVEALARLNAAGHFPDAPVFMHVNSCAFAPDGSSLVSAGDDRSLRLWDPATGEQLRMLEGFDGEDCLFTPDGTGVIWATGNDVKLWDLASGEVTATFDGHSDTVNACALSPDGSLLVSAAQDGTLKLWDTRTAPGSEPRAGHRERVSGCAVAPDGSYVLSVSWEYYPGDTVRICETASGRELRALRSEVWGIEDCAIAPDGSFAVCAGHGGAPDDGDLDMWDLERGTRLRSLEAEAGSCAVSPDSSTVITAEGLWDAASGERVATLEVDVTGVTDCALTPDGSQLVTGRSDGELKVWALADRTVLIRFDTGQAIQSCAVAADRSFVVCGGRDGRLKLWQPATGAELRTLAGHDGSVAGCEVSPDGAFVASVGADGALRLWDPDTGAELATLFLPAPLRSVALGPDGRLVACGDDAGTVHLVEVENVELRARPAPRPAPGQAPAPGPDPAARSWWRRLRGRA